MKKHIPTLLITMTVTALYSQQGSAAGLTSQCMLGVPSYDRPLTQDDTNDLLVTINADRMKGDYPDDAVFTGSVDIMQGNSRLQADEVQLHRKEAPGQPESVRTVDTLSSVHYDDDQVILKGPKGWVNLNTRDTNVWEGDYQMVSRRGRGKADLIKQYDKNRYTILDNGSFTSCLPGSSTWGVVGSEIIHDREEQVAKIWNTHFKVGPVPIFYSPYLQLPVGDKRRSGFSTPNAKYTTINHFEFYLPYCQNIAPNMDATITPHYMHRRGNIMWEDEFRYLSRTGAGLMELDYLPSDKVYEDEHPSDDSSRRWLFYWDHSGVMDQVWRFNVDYTKVSGPSYFSGFDNKYGPSTDGCVTRKFSVDYAVQNFDAIVSTKQLQAFSEQNTSSYLAKPQLDVNYYQNDVGPFDTRVYDQAVRFVNTRDDMPEATRVRLEPTINLPLSNNWGSINTETKLLATNCQQTNPDWYNSRNTIKLDGSVNRVIPQFKVDGKMVSKRGMEMLAPGYTQTLEPRVQYLYVPYRDQSDIYNYGLSLLQSNYSGLLRDQIYGGLDCIASANQVTTGVTSRIYDDAAVERFNISVGQIYCFTESHTGDDNITWENDDKTGSLVWTDDTYWRISKRWGLRSGIQCDTRLDNVVTSNSSIEYRWDGNRLAQLNYHHASPGYIQATLPRCYSTIEQCKNGVSQVGATASWPVTNRWSIIGAYYYDTNANKQADSMLGVQYSSCCYAIRVDYERKLNGQGNDKQHAVHDNTIGLSIELRGLSSNCGLSMQEMLCSNTLPYQNSL